MIRLQIVLTTFRRFDDVRTNAVVIGNILRASFEASIVVQRSILPFQWIQSDAGGRIQKLREYELN